MTNPVPDVLAQVNGTRTAVTATILNTASLSGIVDLSGGAGLCAVALIMPAAWTAAALTFQASIDGTNFFNVYNTAGAEVSIAAPLVSQYIALDPSDFASFSYLKIRSGPSATAVAQGADRILTLVVRSL